MSSRFDESNELKVGARQGLVTAAHAMLGSTSNPLAVQAGLDQMRGGGSAADAALTTAVTQIVLNAGAHVSFAGFLSALYYQKSSNQVFYLDAGYNAPLQEKRPLTIPPLGFGSGRQVLVPGFFAGLQALHQKFGRLPFAALFEPALELAESGSPVGPLLAGSLMTHLKLLRKHPQLAHLLKPDGAPFKIGDRLRQPLLAETLRRIAERGTDEFYAGAWARRFIEAVQSAGGCLELEDLTRYQARWNQPLRTGLGDLQVYGPGDSSPGGMETLLALKLCAEADVGRYDQSAPSLYWLLNILRVTRAVALDPKKWGASWGLDLTEPLRSSSLLWKRMQAPDWHVQYQRLVGEAGKTPLHSAGIVALDPNGDALAMLHTVNTEAWGSTGLCVGGIPIPDSGGFQQLQISQAGPGGRIQNSANPIIVAGKDGFLMAGASIGAGVVPVSVESSWLVLNQSLDPFAAAEAPKSWEPSPEKPDQELLYGKFKTGILGKLSKLGIHWARPPKGNLASAGHWVGLVRRQEIEGGGSNFLNGHLQGY